MLIVSVPIGAIACTFTLIHNKVFNYLCHIGMFIVIAVVYCLISHNNL